MITNPAIIGLLSVLKKGMSLLYEWQYVPHSISSYVRSKFNTANSDIWQMTRTLLVKKVTYELTILMSYLAKMKIETELSMHTLGISYDEKLKLYLNPRSKMGIRS
jgi:DNA-binding transcriptional regulator GbsR (MarR family)